MTAALNLVSAYDVLHQSVGRYLSQAGLSKSTFNILMLLAEAEPKGMLLHEIGDMLLVTKANVTGLIDHLEQLQYVRRVIDPEDRRGRLARITERGAELIDKILPGHFSNIARLLQDLSADEKQSLIDLLRKARASMLAGSKAAAEARVRRTA